MALRRLLVALATSIFFLSDSCQPCECGTGGSPGNWPWLASILNNGAYACAGTLVSDRWVLTAAQCLMTWQSDSPPVVSLGSPFFRDYKGSELTREVDLLICYEPQSYEPDDICMLRLSHHVNFSSSVKPVCLSAEGSSFHSGASSWVAGWGSEALGKHTTHTYYETKTTIMGENECKCRKGNSFRDKSLCAGVDSYSSLKGLGLPLMVQKDLVWIQTGILTSGCSGAEPCIYTDVSRYHDWIRSFQSREKFPGFVDFTSPGENSDLYYRCSRPLRPDGCQTEVHVVYENNNTGNQMQVHFSQLLSLWGLVLSLFVLF